MIAWAFTPRRFPAKLLLSAGFLLSIAMTATAQQWHWQRDDLVLNPSGLDLSKAASWAWGDVDGDGFVDVVIREDRQAGTGRLVCYRGGVSHEPPYWVIAPELINGLEEPESSYGISVADLDGDGSLEFVTRVYTDSYWRMLCWKKNGQGKWFADSLSIPTMELGDSEFTNKDPFFADVDADADLDMILTANASFRSVGVRFFENTGTPGRAQFRDDSTRLVQVYQSPAGYQTWSATMMHADADSLLDLLVASETEGYFEVSCYPGEMDSTGLHWSGKPKSALFGSLSGEAIRKIQPLKVEPEGESALLLLQYGTGRIHMRSTLSGHVLEEDYYRCGPLRYGGISSAIPFDHNNDGTMDLLAIGHFYGFNGAMTSMEAYQRDSLMSMSLWRNTHWFGTATSLGDVQDFKAQLVDVNRDGRMDFAISAYPFYFSALQNSESGYPGVWRPSDDLVAPFARASHTDTCYFDPSFTDLDGDGDVDLLVAEIIERGFGAGTARYRFFENRIDSGTVSWLQLSDWSNGLGDLENDVTYLCNFHGNFADLDNDGDSDLVFGMRDGSLSYYENAGNANTPAWQLRPEVFAGIDVGDYASPSFGDFDSDGRVDLFVGNRSGELFFYRNEMIVGVEEHSRNPQGYFFLHQNHPNPFNAGTIITYEMPHADHVQLKIYDLLGREVATLVDEPRSAGKHQVRWTGTGASSAVYFYELRTGDKVERRKLLLIQ